MSATIKATPNLPTVPSAASFTPEFIRLPPPGLKCPYTGLSRSAINELILPTLRNDYTPPVKSFCLRQKGAKTGIRLVSYPGIRDYIRVHEETFTKAE